MESLRLARRRPLPDGSSSMESLRLAFGLCTRSFAVRAPCAHQRKSNASHKAKRFQKRADHREGLGKDCDHHFPFPRARTKGRVMLRTRQSVSKDGAVAQWLVKGQSLSTIPFPPSPLLLAAAASARRPYQAVAQERDPPPMTKGAALLPRPSCVPLAFAFGYRSAPFRGSGTLAASAA